MKTKVKQLVAATLIAILFIGGNVNANGTEITASGHENILEKTLEIEDWMMNENLWIAEKTFEFEYELEENFEVEDWMLKENNWETQSFLSISPELEFENLILEDWMISSINWTEENELQTIENELEIEVEDWMTNNMVWFR